MDKPHQSKFWQQIAETVAEGWEVSLGDSDLSTALSPDTFLYVVNAVTKQLVMVALKAGDAATQIARLKQDQLLFEEVKQRAGASLLTLLREWPDTDPPTKLVQAAATCTLGALAVTKTYEIHLGNTGSLAGHWLYVIYPLMDGTALGRPAVLAPPERGPLPPDAIANALAAVIRADQNPATSVGGMIRRAGGLIAPV